MAKTLEKGAGFEPRQKQFLDLVSKDPYLTKRFYLTGGTALSVFYLNHRESHDVDLFSEKEVNVSKIRQFLDANKRLLGVTKIDHTRFLGLNSFYLKYLNKDELKVDFNFYPYPRIEKGVKWKNVEVDSELDIAANKVHTISTRARDRDFVDLYLLCLKHNYGIKNLRMLAKAKFDWDINPLHLSEIFLTAKERSDIPKMLIPFNKKKMDKFYVDLTKELERDIFR